MDEDEDQKASEDELDDYVKPFFWLFVQRARHGTELKEYLEMKFYLYCGYEESSVLSLMQHICWLTCSSSSSDTTQTSCEPQAILDELINEFNRLCRMVNQVS